MASGMNSTKRFLVRTSLITGSTIATIVGAQSLATLDINTNSDQATNSIEVQAAATETASLSDIVTINAVNIPTTKSDENDEVVSSSNSIVVQQPSSSVTQPISRRTRSSR